MDGVVIEGQTTVDESMITGEPMPVGEGHGRDRHRRHGERDRRLRHAAERVGRETLLAHIVRLVGEAQRSRAPIQRLADRIAAWFVPAVMAVAALAFVAWALVGPEPRFAYALVTPYRC